MTATDILRAMLDERGVEWWPSDDPCCEDIITHWRVGQIQWTAIEGEKDLWLNAGIAGYEPFTPAQVIAATLGSGTCKRVFYKPTGVYVCSECGLGLSKKLEKYCFLRFCPNCGRRVVS